MKAFLIFWEKETPTNIPYISGNGNISYISGRSNLKKLLIFPEVIFQTRKNFPL